MPTWENVIDYCQREQLTKDQRISLIQNAVQNIGPVPDKLGETVRKLLT